MVTVRVTRRNGETRAVECKAGKSLMLNLKKGGIDEIAAICASCGTCHVHVAAEWLGRLPPMREDEDMTLSFCDWRPDSRLACQIAVTDDLDGLCVTLAPEN